MKERVIEISPDERVYAIVVRYQDRDGAEQEQAIEVAGIRPIDLGSLKFRVGLVSDLHFDIEDAHNSEYASDLVNAVGYFRERGVDFILCPGDLCEYSDGDLKAFNEVYNAHAWAKTDCQLRFFAAVGNHDYLRLFKKGQDLEALSQQFRPFTGEDAFAKYGYAEKTDYLQFFEYDGAWDRQYVRKENRTVKSKLSYWFRHKGMIFVTLAVDYGDDTGEVWDELARGYHLLDHGNRYVKQMVEYVQDTNYAREDGSLDFQFYNPNALVWLKDILENTRGTRKVLNMHHFLPHKAGDSDGACSRLRVWPYSESKAVRQRYYYGSNTPCGLTFWYLDKLTNEFADDLIVVHGHSHRVWNDVTSFCNKDYVVRKPTGGEVTPLVDNLDSLKGTQYDYRLYQRESDTPCGGSAWTIGLPSLSKPVDMDGRVLYGASEGGVMNVYENGIEIECVRFKEEGSAAYANETVKTVVL